MKTQVIVVGTGGVGSAALFELARRGVPAVGIDRFPAGHDRGSSHGHSRIIRLAYFEHPDYVPLLRRAYERWADLERETGQKLFTQTGLLAVGEPEGPTIRGTLAAAHEHRLDVDRLTADECRRRFPGFVVPAGHAAVFEAQAGVLFVERCVHAHLDLAIRAGATHVVGETASRWSAHDGGVEVVTGKTTYRAERLILTAGPWAGDVLRLPVVVRRKQLHWYPAPAMYTAEGGGPAFFFETPGGDFYGIPALDGYGLKAGEHTGGREVADPLTVDRSLDVEDRGRVEAFLAAHLPAVGRPMTDFATCLYTMSPDANFIVDTHPEHSHVAFAAGLSGHGFKFTGVLGEALVDLALEGKTGLPIGFLSAGRFGRSGFPA